MWKLLGILLILIQVHLFFELTSEGGSDIFILKLDPQSNFIWAKNMGSWASSLDIDAHNYIYLTGSFSNTTDFNPNAGIFNLTSIGSTDIFVEKLSPTGNFIWAIQMGGTSYDVGNSIKVNSLGEVYIAGTFYGTADFDPNNTIYNLISEGSGEVFVTKLLDTTSENPRKLKI